MRYKWVREKSFIVESRISFEWKAFQVQQPKKCIHISPSEDFRISIGYNRRKIQDTQFLSKKEIKLTIRVDKNFPDVWICRSKSRFNAYQIAEDLVGVNRALSSTRHDIYRCQLLRYPDIHSLVSISQNLTFPYNAKTFNCSSMSSSYSMFPWS